jgi:hypothetical protein
VSLALASVAGAAWWLAPNSEPPALLPSAEKTQISAPASALGPDEISLPPGSFPELETVAEAPASKVPELALGTGSLAWEQQIATTVSAHGNGSAAAARAIFALLPTLPEEALATATESALSQLSVQDYPAVALPRLLDLNTPGQSLAVLFADLLEKPARIKLPALLTLAKNPLHPFAELALDDLKLLLKADHGSSWHVWEVAISQALAAPAVRSSP